VLPGQHALELDGIRSRCWWADACSLSVETEMKRGTNPAFSGFCPRQVRPSAVERLTGTRAGQLNEGDGTRTRNHRIDSRMTGEPMGTNCSIKGSSGFLVGGFRVRAAWKPGNSHVTRAVRWRRNLFYFRKTSAAGVRRSRRIMGSSSLFGAISGHSIHAP
jgi:hypothetical protein